MNLILKDFQIELRQRYILSSIFLYVISTVFIISKILQTVSPMLWNAIFWIVFMFTAVNALMKSFNQEISSRELYYYSIANPIQVIIAKMVYNFINLLLMSLLLFGAFVVFISNPISNVGLFLTAILLASLSLGVILTLVASIAAKGGNSATLMSVLSIPLTLPVLLLVIKISSAGIGIINDTGINTDISMLLAIIIILTGVSVLLFPQIWRT